MERVIQKLLKWASGSSAPPYEIVLSITNSCNLRCIFCSRYRSFEYSSSNELPVKKLIEIIYEAKKMGVHHITIGGGGEPFTKPKKMLSVMCAIKACEFGGSITTNGTLFNEKIIKSIIKIGWDEIVFSLDGPNNAIDDCLRGRGTFDKTIKSIKLLQHWKNKMNRMLPRIRFNFVLVNKNYDKIDQMIELAYELGASDICFIPITSWDVTTEKLKLSEEETIELQEYVKEGKKIAEMYHLITNLDDILNSRLILETGDIGKLVLSNVDKGSSNINGFTSLPCFYPWLKLNIDSRGFINPCDYGKQISHIGNRHLENIWYNDEYLNAIRKQMIKKKFIDSCSHCCAPQVAENIRLRKELRNRGLY